MPSSPTAGDIVALKDYNGTFNSNNLTIDRNGSPLNGATSNFAISTNFTSMTLVYVDSTEGWMPVEEGTGFIGENFIVATGGTITTCGNDKIHTFTGPGTFTVCSVADASANNQISYIVVAGGGGGGYYYGGGGGAGGFREDKSPTTTYTASPLDGAGDKTVTATGYPITVGGGGASATYPTTLGNNGSPSSFFSITSAGGGAGRGNPGGGATGNSGGSGGGGGGTGNVSRTGGAGNTPPTTPSQGFPGGSAPSGGGNQGAAGGGATSAPPSSPPDADIRTGGNGAGTAINPAAGTPGPSGSLRYFSGGGAGGPNAAGGGGYGGGGNYNTGYQDCILHDIALNQSVYGLSPGSNVLISIVASPSVNDLGYCYPTSSSMIAELTFDFCSSPDINWISPNSGDQGQNLSVTISGSNMDYYDNWSNVSSFRFTNWSGGNTFYGNSSYASGNYLYGSVSIPNNQPTGYYDLQVYDNATNQWITENNEF